MTEAAARQILGVDERASQDDIRHAYRQLARVWHPDRFTGDPQLQSKAVRQLQSINAAYTTLRQTPRTTPRPARQKHYAHDDRPEAATAPPRPAPATAQRPRPMRRIPARWAAGAALAASTLLVILALWRPAAEPGVRGDGVRGARPTSGDELLDIGSDGYGVVVARNAGHTDAVLLMTGRTNRRAVYVRAGEQVQLLNVAPDRYTARIASGRDWTGERFARDNALQEFDATIEFHEQDIAGSVEATKLTITIGPDGARAQSAERPGQSSVFARWIRMPRSILSPSRTGGLGEVTGLLFVAVDLADVYIGQPLRAADPLTWLLPLAAAALFWVLVRRSR